MKLEKIDLYLDQFSEPTTRILELEDPERIEDIIPILKKTSDDFSLDYSKGVLVADIHQNVDIKRLERKVDQKSSFKPENFYSRRPGITKNSELKFPENHDYLENLTGEESYFTQLNINTLIDRIEEMESLIHKISQAEQENRNIYVLSDIMGLKGLEGTSRYALEIEKLVRDRGANMIILDYKESSKDIAVHAPKDKLSEWKDMYDRISFS